MPRAGRGTIADTFIFTDHDSPLKTPGPHIYGGIRTDALVVADPGHLSSMAFLFFLDLPLSLGAGSAFLLSTVPALQSTEQKKPRGGAALPLLRDSFF